MECFNTLFALTEPVAAVRNNQCLDSSKGNTGEDGRCLWPISNDSCDQMVPSLLLCFMLVWFSFFVFWGFFTAFTTTLPIELHCADTKYCLAVKEKVGVSRCAWTWYDISHVQRENTPAVTVDQFSVLLIAKVHKCFMKLEPAACCSCHHLFFRCYN